MSKYFNKVEVPQAVQGSTKIKLANQHITTNEFMRFSVGTFMPVIPKTQFKLSSRTFVRMNPLAHPVYGTATVKKKLFFVPFRTIFPAWNDFIENAVHHYDNSTAIVPHVPQIMMADLIALFMTQSYSTPTTNTAYDFTDYLGATRNFTILGKFAYQILCSLGYKVDFTNPYSHLTQGVNYPVSALKLLCLARIYCDYYFNPMYTDRTEYQNCMQIFTDNSTNNGQLTQSQIGSIFGMLHYTFYQDDYFTTAFDNPVGPVNSGEGYNISILDNTKDGRRSVVTMYSNNTPQIQGTDINGNITNEQPNNLTEYIQNALRKLTNYFRRNAFVGGRASARHLAEFGIQLNNEQNNRSVYVDGYDFDIMFSDIMSNADTNGAALGAYAGKGIGQGEKGGMTYFNNEFGYYMEVYHISPRVGYYQGMTKDTFQLNLFDFYHGDMDNLGMDAVRQAELAMPLKNPIDVNNNPSFVWSDLTQKVFGFQPRYLGEYKNKHDMLTGDFLLDSVNTGMDAWHLMRVINPLGYVHSLTKEIDMVHSYNFTRSRNPEQWSRIFATNKIDNFIINHQYWYEISAPMKSAYDMLDFEDYNKRITMNLEGRVEA